MRFFSGVSDPNLSENNETILIAWNFQTPENLGGIIRLAANLSLKKVIHVTCSDHILNHTKLKRVARSALNFIHFTTISPEEFKSLIPEGFQLVALETYSKAGNLFETVLPDKMALIIGNEKMGIPEPILSQCSQSVYIPMPGEIKSMNAVQAASVACFEWFRQKNYPSERIKP